MAHAAAHRKARSFGDLRPRQYLSGDNSDRQYLSGDNSDRQYLSGDNSDRQYLSGDNSDRQFLSGDNSDRQFLSGDNSDRQYLSGDNSALNQPHHPTEEPFWLRAKTPGAESKFESGSAHVILQMLCPWCTQCRDPTTPSNPLPSLPPPSQPHISRWQSHNPKLQQNTSRHSDGL